MNYYEHHIGDYAEATGHLSILEDGVYSRLIRKYYATEKPLPADVKEVQRLICARSRAERAAVQAVLREFFEQRDDGWHNERCDEEIVRYLEAEPERETRRTNEALRVKRHREERAHLFDALHAAGQAPAWNTSMAALRELHARYCNTPATGPVTPVTRTNGLPATGPVTPLTASHSQSPFPSPQSLVEDLSQDPHSVPLDARGRTRATASPGETAGSDVKAANGHAAARASDDRQSFQRLKSTYPAGIYPESDWLLAERSVRQAIDEGDTWDGWTEAAARYRAQLDARGRLGTEFVKSPQKFFGQRANLHEKFPLPKAPAARDPEDTGWTPKGDPRYDPEAAR